MKGIWKNLKYYNEKAKIYTLQGPVKASKANSGTNFCVSTISVAVINTITEATYKRVYIVLRFQRDNK